jgi:hypothetical protein
MPCIAFCWNCDNQWLHAQRVSANATICGDDVTRLLAVHTACCAPGPCAAAGTSTRYGKRLLTDPDDRLGDPLCGEPAADFGEELSNRPGRRRPIEFEVPAVVALLADAAALAPQPLGEQNSAQLVRCADPFPTSV